MAKTYYHVTPSRNVRSIRLLGIQGRFSRGKMAVSWVCVKSQVAWAILHTCRRHDVNSQEVTVFQVRVDAKHLRKHGKGRYYYMSDIPVNDLRPVDWGRIIEGESV